MGTYTIYTQGTDSIVWKMTLEQGDSWTARVWEVKAWHQAFRGGGEGGGGLELRALSHLVTTGCGRKVVMPS